MRVAVVSSPRSGNMWLRRLLVAAYGLEERSAFSPDELDWDALPARCALQFHWHRTPDFVAQLERYDCSVAVLIRDPLDVLVSILHFAQHEPDTARWLHGEGGDETPLLGADPTSAAFLAYATGPRAKALLAVTPEWWPHASARVRYEDLVGDTVAELERIFQALDAPPLLTPAQAVEAVSFERLQKEAPNHHFWQGRAGLWRELLPTASAIAIAEAHDAHRREFGYEVVVDEATARARWQALAVTHELAAAS